MDRFHAAGFFHHIDDFDATAAPFAADDSFRGLEGSFEESERSVGTRPGCAGLCPICDSTKLRSDEVALQGAGCRERLMLWECGRCAHRWTQTDSDSQQLRSLRVGVRVVDRAA